MVNPNLKALEILENQKFLEKINFWKIRNLSLRLSFFVIDKNKNDKNALPIARRALQNFEGVRTIEQWTNN